eukprot:TRINITY_DN34854_c0_g2_i1.p1 TRINITY_DN34854_c0_g2~~TRINITY_DN34854_c0_g2_i1.p1  ORF type:complete len:221 (+),score=46.26 TRINITY_DN34854_c0_g2_i1:1181-1843(+)
MAAASALEHARRSSGVLILPDGTVAISACSTGAAQPMSTLSVWTMLLPYFLLGAAGVLVTVPMFDLCYNEVSAELRSAAAVAALFTRAVGSSATAAISQAFAQDVQNDLNDSKVEYEYYVAGGLALCSAVLLVLREHRFEHRGGRPAPVQAGSETRRGSERLEELAGSVHGLVPSRSSELLALSGSVCDHRLSVELGWVTEALEAGFVLETPRHPEGQLR